MGYMQEISSTFGGEATSILKKWANFLRKLTAARNKRIFLLQCRLNNVYPPHMVNKVNKLYDTFVIHTNFITEFDNILTSLKRKLLNLEITMVAATIRNIENSISLLRTRAETILPTVVIRNFENFQLMVNEKYFIKIKRTQMEKMHKLTKINNKCNDNAIANYTLNLTEEDIPPEVLQILSLGPQFAIAEPVTKLPLNRIVTDVEYIIDDQRDLSDEKKNDLRLKSTNIISNFVSRNKHNNRPQPYQKQFAITKRFLKDNPHLLVSKSDKSKNTVVLYRQVYLNEVAALLDDPNFYKRLSKDPTNKYQLANNNLIRKLEKEGQIDDLVRKELVIANAVAPRLYALPKTHKDPLKFRPIASCINSPTYKLAKFLNRILSNLNDTFEFNIKNSYELVELIKDFTIPDDHILISLDVVALFTNVPKELVIRAISNKWDLIANYTTIEYRNFVELVELCFDASYFRFGDEFYQQIFGCAMGNPASVIFANLVMNEALHEILNKIPFNIPLLKLYVDDIFAIIPYN